MSETSPYQRFTAEDWGRLRAGTPLSLSEDELRTLRGRGETVSLDEVTEIYLPLARLLNLYVEATQGLFRATHEFLGHNHARVPYVIGLAGSVAVGKSTTARILKALLARWPSHRKVDLITTDGFLYPTRVLEERGLMQRKGFPESYDLGALVKFLIDIKSGLPRVPAPVYSHETYDIVPGAHIAVDRPDILILEGLNVLQTAKPHARDGQLFVSDFFNFSIYLDADEEVIRRWYIDRFLGLRATAFQDPNAYFHRYARLTDAEAEAVADQLWTTINLANLRENIRPTRDRARLVLRKGADHRINEVWLRKL